MIIDEMTDKCTKNMWNGYGFNDRTISNQLWPLISIISAKDQNIINEVSSCSMTSSRSILC